jgi:hypothetical protein
LDNMSTCSLYFHICVTLALMFLFLFLAGSAFGVVAAVFIHPLP